MKGQPEGKTPAECCQLPEVIPQSEFQKCEAANPKPPPPSGGPHGGPKGCCVSECIMNNTGIMIGGKLNKAAAVKYLSDKMAGDAEGVKVVTAAVDFCEKEGNAKQAEFDEMAKSVPAGEKSCNMISGYMIGCVNGQILKNCPKDKFGADPACEAMKAFVDKCGILFPPKPKA